MRDEILQKFGRNLGRVRNLITLYQDAAGAGQGRRPVHSTDILRAATVFLHASLEDVFRAVAVWKFPEAPESVLDDIPMIGTSRAGRAEKFYLGKLAPHRVKTVEDLIEESVQAYLERFTVNNTTEISNFCTKIGVEVELVNGQFAELQKLISRRHHIVHQADSNTSPGQGNHYARSMGVRQVEGWLESVEQFVNAFIAVVPD